MKPFDIFIAYVSWGDSGKTRPVLVYKIDDEIVHVYSITSQYVSKSVTIQAQYLTIIDWKEAGLDRPSYVDAGEIVELPIIALSSKLFIGKLSEADRKRLLEFLA